MSKTAKNTHQKRRTRHRRIRKKISGDAQRPRLCVFRSARHIYAQAVDDDTGQTLAAASTRDKAVRDGLKSSPGNKESAGKVGQVIAQRLVELGVQRVVFDRGGHRFHGRIKALAESAREAGLEF